MTILLTIILLEKRLSGKFCLYLHLRSFFYMQRSLRSWSQTKLWLWSSEVGGWFKKTIHCVSTLSKFTCVLWGHVREVAVRLLAGICHISMCCFTSLGKAHLTRQSLLPISMKWQITDGWAKTDSHEKSLGEGGTLGNSVSIWIKIQWNLDQAWSCWYHC